MDFVTHLEPPREYIEARAVLLDALDALSAHLDAVVLVGAQAVYFHTGGSDLAVAPTTTDADVALAPDLLCDEPLLADALNAAGFIPGANPGTWCGRSGIPIDIKVPEALSGSGGRRGARLAVHGNRVARRTLGLEPALVDSAWHGIAALDPDDPRRARLRVAGPAALLVAKIVKLEERRATPHRQKPKDGLDVLRLLQVIDMNEVAGRLRMLASDRLAGQVTTSALNALAEHGRDANGPIASAAASAVSGLDDEERIAVSTTLLIDELLRACGDAGWRSDHGAVDRFS
ncbi:hypothetical protein NLX83_05565 [Allokutzneria sp. A3M-2-11 16]|uniref:hypothetical protein n=1 Tax=Allokutzneria sp. A3M-2-11 16 TaxID=2962043 RepID=UPI0020B88F6E|nr:hypothetical protein [Allokutzneria sp. A3M-2-11 16]MCP3798720.1 hypothetical protein [Allokutzneria sp. A3M-2-11 16]